MIDKTNTLKIKGKKILSNNFRLNDSSEYIVIDGIDKNRNYKILFNSKIYPVDIVENNLIFIIPKSQLSSENNIISLHIYDGDIFLYSTNSIFL